VLGGPEAKKKPARADPKRSALAGSLVAGPTEMWLARRLVIRHPYHLPAPLYNTNSGKSTGLRWRRAAMRADHPVTWLDCCSLGMFRANESAGEVVPAQVAMNTRGEIEAAVCQGIARFEQEYLGRGPKDVRAHLLGDLVVVRLQGVLTAAEKHLVTSLPADKGRDLLKQVRAQLIEVARPPLAAMIREATGVELVSLHHDISTVTGEEVILFTLAQAPAVRDLKKR
jgi:uncharacterized protein YbcI